MATTPTSASSVLAPRILNGTYSVKSADPLGAEATPAYGGDADLSWSAPTGRANKQTLIVSSQTINFGTIPKHITCGFDHGWMESSAVGTKFANHADTVTGELWEYEFAAGSEKREIDAKMGFKSLVSTGAISIGAGMINWDAGAGLEIPENAPIFYSSWFRASAAGVSVGASASQLKTYRTGHDKNLLGDGAENSSYHKIFAESADLNINNDGEYTRYNGVGGGLTTHNLTHPTFDDRLTRHDLVITSGTVGQATGSIVTTTIRPKKSDGIVALSANNIQFYFAESPNRFRFMKCQDFTQHLLNAVIRRTDLYWQVGTLKRFEIATGPTPALSTDSKILKPLTWANDEVELHIYGQSFANNLNKYLHYYNDAGVFVKGVSL